MSETQQETVVWTLPHLYAWMHVHLDEGHRLTVRTPEDSDHNAGVFACSCGTALDVRPVAVQDPTSGLYAVSGPRPVTSGLETTERALPELSASGSLAVVLDKSQQRVRVEFGRLVTFLSLTPADAKLFAATLLAKAAQMESS